MKSRRLIASSEAQDWASSRLKIAHFKHPRFGSLSGWGRCPLWVISRHLQCNTHVRFPPNSDMDCVFPPCPLSAKSRHSTRRPSPGLPRGSMARATRSQLELDLPLMLKSVYPMGESSGANNRTCVLCFDLAVLLAD